ncbi:molybdate ABC transporter substrate-binding protein [Olivibacter sp. CPCC 100613]|uniref:molybdate ABC transporter substrate-binding protein n=1 Tax=Olivibacter sp. CPCC 100613 TaxID=3079931 RepID=UPI002FFA62E1
MKKISAVLLLILIVLQSNAQPKLTVAVAANMQYAAQELISEFNKTEDITINIVLGASGNLSQQIMHGAPFDIFIAADEEFPRKIAANGFSLEPPKIYAQGILVLWTAKPNLSLSEDLTLLQSEKIKSIAIANPKTAPYGQAAIALLKKRGIYEKVSSKLVTGESITQTSHFIATKNADIGFTAKSIVISKKMKEVGKWLTLNIQDYPPIRQSAVLLKYAQTHHESDAKKFYNFLYSEKANAIYQKFGYVIK